jgi:hypothetical protein
MEVRRLKMEPCRVYRPVDEIRIILMSSRIQIRIKVKSWFRIHIKSDAHPQLWLFAVLRIQIRRIRMFWTSWIRIR